MPPRVLMVSPYLPASGVHAGGARMLRLLDELDADFDLSVLALDGPPLTRDEARRARRELRARGVPLTTVPFDGRFRPHLGRPEPESFAALRSPAMCAQLERMLGHDPPDLLQLEYTPALSWLPPRLDRPLAVTVHQVETLAALRAARSARRWSARVRLLLDANKALAAEAAGLSRAGAVFALTPGEARWIRALAPASRVTLAPMGVDPAPRPAGPAEVDLVFHGDYAHPPNLEAARTLLGAILPAVRAELPGATLCLIGPHLPAELARSARRLGVEVTGRVSDLPRALQRGRVYMAPLTLGAGMRGKILDALACGLPVITTRTGAEGLPGRGGGLCLHRGTAAMARRAVKLLLDPTERVRIGRAGVQTAAEFTWARTAGAVRETYAALLERGGA